MEISPLSRNNSEIITSLLCALGIRHLSNITNVLNKEKKFRWEISEDDHELSICIFDLNEDIRITVQGKVIMKCVTSSRSVNNFIDKIVDNDFIVKPISIDINTNSKEFYGCINTLLTNKVHQMDDNVDSPFPGNGYYGGTMLFSNRSRSVQLNDMVYTNNKQMQL